MPRIRTVKPECWQDEALGAVSREARLLFVGLITQADDEGRQRGASALLKAQVFPYDDDLTPADVEGWLSQLEERLIVRYTVDGESFLALRGWKRNQRISHPSPSVLPSPPEDSGACVVGRDRKGMDKDRSKPSSRKTSPTNGRRPEVVRLCQLLADLIAQNGSKRPDPEQKGWVTACRLMLDSDKRDVAEAERLIRWCQADDFWQGNILSMPTFRKQYDQLRLKAAGHIPKGHLAESRGDWAAYAARHR